MNFIPGLSNDMARECLYRVSYEDFATIKLVCKNWKAEIEDPAFFELRRMAGCSQVIAAIVLQSRPVLPINDFMRNNAASIYLTQRLLVFEMGTGKWLDMPGIGFLPSYSHVIVIGLYIVVIGGWESVLWLGSRSILVYSFMSGKWRRGTDMPGAQRTSFACASYSNRYLYVLGGINKDYDNKYKTTVLKSAIVYDLIEDNWKSMPDMSYEIKDDHKAVCYDGKIHVVCDRSGDTIESFDIATGKWESPSQDSIISSRYYVTDGRIYKSTIGKNEVNETTSKFIAELPIQNVEVTCITACKGKILIIGWSGFFEQLIAYTLDLITNTWEMVGVPEKYHHPVLFCCCMEI